MRLPALALEPLLPVNLNPGKPPSVKRNHSLPLPTSSHIGSLPVSGASHGILPPGRIFLALEVTFPTGSQESSLALGGVPGPHLPPAGQDNRAHFVSESPEAACNKDSFVRIPLWLEEGIRPKQDVTANWGILNPRNPPEGGALCHLRESGGKEWNPEPEKL